MFSLFNYLNSVESVCCVYLNISTHSALATITPCALPGLSLLLTQSLFDNQGRKLGGGALTLQQQNIQYSDIQWLNINVLKYWNTNGLLAVQWVLFLKSVWSMSWAGCVSEWSVSGVSAGNILHSLWSDSLQMLHHKYQLCLQHDHLAPSTSRQRF